MVLNIIFVTDDEKGVKFDLVYFHFCAQEIYWHCMIGNNTLFRLLLINSKQLKQCIFQFNILLLITQVMLISILIMFTYAFQELKIKEKKES